MGHHLGAPQNIQLDQVGGMQFQALRRRCPSPVTGRRAKRTSEIISECSRGVRYRMRSLSARMAAAAVDVVTLGEQVQPGAFALGGGLQGLRRCRRDSETGLPWWRLVSLASIGSYSAASSGSDSSASRRTARSGHDIVTGLEAHRTENSVGGRGHAGVERRGTDRDGARSIRRRPSSTCARVPARW